MLRQVGGESGAAVLIGDVVGSRLARDREQLHRRVGDALAEVSAAYGGTLRFTVGDEYQGTFRTVGGALRATLALRVRLLPEADVRHGVGFGEVRLLDEAARIEDGPGWWAAREAIEAVKAAEQRPATRALRTAYRPAEGQPGPDAAAVNAALTGRDQIVGALSGRGVAVLRGLLDGRTQREIAEAEGVSTSAISQRVRHDGSGMVLLLDELLGGIG